MFSFLRKHKNILTPLALFLFAFLFRVVLLDRIPSGISNDELDYVLNAKSVFLTGTDMSKTWNPFTLTPISSGYPQAELPALLVAPFIGIFPHSLFFARLPYAFINALSVVLIFLIASKITQRKIGIVAGVLAAVNPWFLFFGRTAYDAPVAMFFFLLILLTLLHAKRWHILLACIPIFFGFYTYIGAKLLLLPFLAVSLFYSWYIVSHRKNALQYLLVFLFGIMLVISLFILNPSSAGRASELLTPLHPFVTEQTDYGRKVAIAYPLQNIFVNKLTIFSREAIGKYIGVFSPSYLFLYGDGKFLFSVFYHGVLYLIDGVFLLIGSFLLFKAHKKAFLFLLALILISPLASALSTVGTSYAIRSFLIHPLLLILIASGILGAITFFKRKSHKRVVVGVIVFIYFLLVANFLNIYIARNPVYNSESFNFSARVLAKYVHEESKQAKNIVVLSGNPYTQFKHYLFYTNTYDPQLADVYAAMYRANTFTLENVSFLTCKEKDTISAGSTVIADPGVKCYTPSRDSVPLTVAQLSDGGTLYTIWNGTLCDAKQLKRYPRDITLSSLAVESLSSTDFCKAFITNLE